MSANTKRTNTFRLVITALFTALTAAATLAVRIPTPMNGYVNLGDAVVLMSAWMLGPVWGVFAAAVGSAIADLIAGFAVYAPGTLVIKALCALCAALIFRAIKKDADTHVIRIAKRILSAVAGELVMVAGYFGYAALILGNGLAAASGIPGDSTQAVVGTVLGVSLTELLLKNRTINEYLNRS